RLGSRCVPVRVRPWQITCRTGDRIRTGEPDTARHCRFPGWRRFQVGGQMSLGAARFVTATLACGAMLAAAGSRPAAVQGGTVQGRVEIGVPIKTRRASAAYATRAVVTPALAPASELRNVVVFLKDAPPRPATPIHVAIHQHDENFFPRVVAVPVGSTVD